MQTRGILAVLGLWASCGGSDVDTGFDAAADSNPVADVALELRSGGEPVALEPAFDPEVLDYTAALPLGPTSLEVIVTAPAGAIEIAGVPADSGEVRSVDLAIGANPIPIDAAGVTYQLIANRGAALVEVDGIDGGGDGFGAALALSGNTLVVGIPSDDGAAVDAGAVQVYTRDGAGLWQLQETLVPASPDAGDRFGAAVDIDGDRLVVGAPGEDSAAVGVDGDQDDDTASGAGAAYVFARSGASWSQQAYLKPDNTDAADNFGTSVAIDGDAVVVGAPLEDSAAQAVGGDGSDDTAASAGAAYVFADGGAGAWTLEAYLKADNGESGDLFGGAVAISGDRIAVGAEAEAGPTNALALAGAAYVFVRSGQTWSQQAIIRASNADIGDNFARSLALDGDTLAVGAFTEDGAATGVGGDSASDTVGNSGAAYVFTDGGGGIWSEQAYLKASNTEAGDLFGASVAVAGDRIAVGATDESGGVGGVNGDGRDNGQIDSGAVYVFARNAGVWTPQAYIKPASPTGAANFGTAVAIDGLSLAASAPGAGSVHTFE